MLLQAVLQPRLLPVARAPRKKQPCSLCVACGLLVRGRLLAQALSMGVVRLVPGRPSRLAHPVALLFLCLVPRQQLQQRSRPPLLLLPVVLEHSLHL